ncbi:MAG: thiamine pyrophosphate-binding protein [Myxococcota bacterium]
MSALSPLPESSVSRSESTITLSDLIVHYLELMEVEYVFGVPGVHIMRLYEALARSAARGGPRAILTRHESGAAFMAAGYARETGKLGVCCATAGPGTTNAITGIMSAQSDHIPVLLLSGQGMIPAWGQGYVQESSPYEGSYPDIVDTTGMLAALPTDGPPPWPRAALPSSGRLLCDDQHRRHTRGSHDRCT